jgi:UDP-N-acetylglucosamine/UDP-N-acetylgalactosamine diphosphorylase
MLDYQQAVKKMEAVGQAHVLEYFDCLTTKEQAYLLAQIENCDVSLIHKVMNGKSQKNLSGITPIEVLTHTQILQRYADYENTGLEAIRQNKVAALLLAGGQGSRVGVEYSKGMVNIGISRELFIFECLFNNILEVTKKAGCWIPFCIMTSKNNRNKITAFFESKNYFGYNPEWIHFFDQDMWEDVDFNGKYLMSSKSSIAQSPNGNGSWFDSMQKDEKGVLSKLRSQGVEWINVFAMENVLQKIADPVFIGATIKDNYLCGAKVVKKACPKENIGVMCKRDGKPAIVEYYEMTDEMNNSRDAKRDLLYNYGVILNYLFNLKQMNDSITAKMPIHSAKKKINTINAQGLPYTPETENGYKPERLALDMVEIIGNCLPFEVIRDKEFAPIKNKEGIDSIETAQELLKRNGIDI